MGFKSRMKRDNPLRHKAFLKLRGLPSGGLEVVTMKNGAEQIINPVKRFLLGKPYTNPELQKEVLRKVGQHAIGDEKYAQLEAKAQELENKAQ